MAIRKEILFIRDIENFEVRVTESTAPMITRTRLIGTYNK